MPKMKSKPVELILIPNHTLRTKNIPKKFQLNISALYLATTAQFLDKNVRNAASSLNFERSFLSTEQRYGAEISCGYFGYLGYDLVSK